MSAVSINEEQRLFVLKNSSGFTCLGFDVVFRRLAQYAKSLGRTLPSSAGIGKKEQYQEYLAAESAFIATNPQNTQFDPDTPVAVQAYLEAYRKSGSKVRLFFGNPETGKDWLSEWDVVGRIGRSMGPLKVALLVPAGEDGGGAILTSNVLRIVDFSTKREVYRHANYKAPTFEVKAGAEPGYPHEVWVDGKPHARLKTRAKADSWIAFMQGLRMTRG